MTRRILVDLLGFTGARGGTETYAREICQRLPDASPDSSFVALTGRAGASRVREFFPGAVRVVPWVGADRVSWAAGEVLTVNAIAHRLKADLLWNPANFGPIRAGTARVTTVHDVIYHHALDAGGVQAIARTSALLMTQTARTADHIITGSHTAATELEQRMGIMGAKVHVIPHGTSAPLPVDNPWAVLTPLGIPRDRPLVLSTGNRLLHKNFAGLLAAVATIPADERPLTVITGGGENDPLHETVAHHGLQADVVLPGWVTSTQLEALYAAASVYACPSLSEGFGLPVLDAMRRGVHVVANDVDVLREVGGPIATYADATNPTDYGGALRSALASPHADRAQAGRERAALFTWDRSAAATAAVFATALNRG